MKRHFVTQWILLFLLLTSIASISGCKESPPQYTEITENDILAIMSEVERATIAKDLDGVIKHLAPFVVINITMASNDLPFMPQRVQIGRDQYAEELKKVFAKLSHHEYRRENAKITISDDKRSAKTETDIVEIIVMDEKETRTTTHETSALEIIDEKILVTSINAVIVKKE